ncbi:hypothetical protein AAFF_G00393220 [Aldrovandia affinis]|uniref:Uncharacterized protein n=1 Tax=Aldrovandia affinis TaxID=143900 RepID=A0AAD7SDM8_9TELE|nr:hypothetical protein AAFF_G00393220 [Aldrovandia affinis]
MFRCGGQRQHSVVMEVHHAAAAGLARLSPIVPCRNAGTFSRSDSNGTSDCFRRPRAAARNRCVLKAKAFAGIRGPAGEVSGLSGRPLDKMKPAHAGCARGALRRLWNHMLLVLKDLKRTLWHRWTKAED